jgi:hypothetical protein
MDDWRMYIRETSYSFFVNMKIQWKKFQIKQLHNYFCVGTDNFVNLHEDFTHFQFGQPFYLGLKTQIIN